MEININQKVKVKLTEFGKKILRQEQEKKYKELFGEKCEFELKLDEDGYYEEQLWKIMNLFGKYMSPIVEKEKMPFESKILIQGVKG